MASPRPEIDFTIGQAKIKLSGQIPNPNDVKSIQTGSSYDVSPTRDNEKLLTAISPATFPFTFNLPESPEDWFVARIGVNGAGEEIVVQPAGSDTIVMPQREAGAPIFATKLESSSPSAFLTLTYSSGLWAILDASGAWTDGGVGGNPEKWWYFDGVSGTSVVSSNTAVEESKSGWTYVADSGGDDPLTFTLPETPKDGTQFTFQLLGNLELKLTAQGSDEVYVGRLQNPTIASRYRGSTVKLVYDAHDAVWRGVNPSGKWYDPLNIADQVLFDANIFLNGYIADLDALNMISDADQSGSPPGSPAIGDAYIVNNWGLGHTNGDMEIWDGSSWIVAAPGDGANPNNNLTVGIAIFRGTAAGTFAGEEGKVYKYNVDYGWHEDGPAQYADYVIAETDSVFKSWRWTYDKNRSPNWSRVDYDRIRVDTEGLSGNRTLDLVDDGAWLQTTGTGAAIVITVPSGLPVGFRFRVGVGGSNPAAPREAQIDFSAAGVYVPPSGAPKTSWRSASFIAFIEFCQVGAGQWAALNANGYWADDLTTPTTAWRWDGTVPGAIAGNLVEFDTHKTISDAGSAVSDLVAKATFNANTLLKADSDDTPAALTVGEQTLVGRITSGVIAALTATQVRTLINVADGADVTGSNPPQAHKLTHEPGGGDAMTVDAAASTGSLRTIGTGALQACAGNDSRLSDARNLTVYAQAAEPTLNDGDTAIWVDTDDSNRTYLIHRRSVDSTQVKVELT